MRDLRPLTFTWTGRAMVPKPTALPLAVNQFTPGEEYRLTVEAERNWAFHRAFMATVHEAWTNLPEALAPHFPTADRLRYWALIRCNFADEKTLTLETDTDAELFASFMLSDARDNQHVERIGRTVKIWTAWTMAGSAMSKQEFNDAAQAVMEFLSDLIGVNVQELTANAGAAA